MAQKYKLALLVLLFVGLNPIIGHAATLSISPVNGTFKVGDKVTVKILVSSDTPINTISGTVLFPNSIFKIESVSKTESILNFWVSEPSFSRKTGNLNFEGVAFNGFRGKTGTVVTVTLLATKIGTSTIKFNFGQVLANDGQGTDVTSGLNGATLSVEARKGIFCRNATALGLLLDCDATNFIFSANNKVKAAVIIIVIGILYLVIKKCLRARKK